MKKILSYENLSYPLDGPMTRHYGRLSLWGIPAELAGHS